MVKKNRWSAFQGRTKAWDRENSYPKKTDRAGMKAGLGVGGGL